MYEDEQGQEMPENEIEQGEQDGMQDQAEGQDQVETKGNSEERGSKEGRPIQDKIEVLKEQFDLTDDDIVQGKDGEIKIVEKINGKKYLVTPRQYRKGFNLNQAGYQRLNEAKQKQKELDEFKEVLKSDPNALWKFADEHGIDKYQLAEQLLTERLNEYEMTHEEREKLEWEKRYKEKEKEVEEYKNKEQQQIFEQEKQKSMQKYDQELTKAMVDNGFTKMPRETKSHVLYSAIQKLMIANQSNREMSAEDAVFLAKQEWQEQVLGYFDEIDENHIVKLVPERIIKAIRKADLQRLQGGTPTSRARVEHDQHVDLEEYDAPARKKKKQSINDYFHELK